MSFNSFLTTSKKYKLCDIQPMKEKSPSFSGEIDIYQMQTELAEYTITTLVLEK